MLKSECRERLRRKTRYGMRIIGRSVKTTLAQRQGVAGYAAKKRRSRRYKKKK